MVWEYKLVYVGSESADESEYETRLHDGVHLLNEFGSEGWELIGFLPNRTHENLTKFHAVLKRQKSG